LRANRELQGGLFLPPTRGSSAQYRGRAIHSKMRVHRLLQPFWRNSAQICRPISVSRSFFGKIRELQDFDTFFKWTSDEKILVYFHAQWCNLRGFQMDRKSKIEEHFIEIRKSHAKNLHKRSRNA